MLAHLSNSAVRSLAVTVGLGCVLIYATGGLDSPNARGMVGVIAVCFFLFWITFLFMFGPRVPKHYWRRQDPEVEKMPHLALRRERRHESNDGSNGENAGEGSDSGGGGDD
jgi:hypothetical protein